MKAMIFAAGKGTRLQPITNTIPKALVKLNDIVLLEMVINHLKTFGIKDIIINVHYLADQIIDFVNQKNHFGINISFSDESDLLLDTGGGLKKASWFFNDSKPFLVYNTDIVSNINIHNLLQTHKKTQSIATVAVRERKSSRYLLFNNSMELCGWKNNKTQEEIIHSKKNIELLELAFSGIHIINPEIFNYFPNKKQFSIIETYLSILSKEKISGYNHTKDYWFDIGSIEKLKEAENQLINLS